MYFTQDGTTALMYACLNGHEEAVKILLSAKANIDCKDNVSSYTNSQLSF